MPLLLASISVHGDYEPFELRFSAFPLGLMNYSALIVDVTGEGEKDLILISGNDRMKQPVVVYRIDSRAFPWTRFPSWISDTAVYGTGSAAADFDNDGLYEIAIASSRGRLVNDKNGGGIHVFRDNNTRDGDIHLSWLADINITGFQATDMQAADLDYDGDVDLVVSTWEDGDHVGRIYFNEGGTFAAGRSEMIKGTGATRVAVDDLDQDGLLEIIFAGPHLSVFDVSPGASGKRVTLKWQRELEAVPQGVQPQVFGLTVVANKDGRFVIASNKKGLVAFDSKGKRTWKQKSDHPIAALAPVDLDHDGFPDLVVSEFTHDDAGYPCYLLRGKCLGGEAVTYMGSDDGEFESRDALDSELMSKLEAEYGVPFMVAQRILPASIYHLDGCTFHLTEKQTVTRGRVIFQLPADFVTSIDEVKVDGKPVLTQAAYYPKVSKDDPRMTYGHIDTSSWIFFDRLLEKQSEVEVSYTVDRSPDMVFASALPSRGTFVLKNKETCQ